ncbi:MAG: tetratricopeptide repeat protein, partial [Wenzhouxiangellaceae bacterium]
QKALLEYDKRDFDAALDWLDRVTGELEGRFGDAAERVMARTLALRGTIHARLDRHAQATEALDQADRLLFALNPRMPEVELIVSGARGMTAYSRGEYEQALQYMQKTLELQRDLGNEHRTAMIVTLGNMAAIANRLNRPEEALDWDREAVAIARQTLPAGDPRIGQALYSLGDTLRQLGRFSEALTALREAAEIQQAAGLDGDFQMVQLARARTLFAVGDYPGALAAASSIRPFLAERWGEGSREALLSLEVELASRALLGENPIPSLRPEIQRRFSALPIQQRDSAMADLLRWRLADIELDYSRPDRVDQWLGFERGDAPEPEHASVLMRWLALRIRRDLAIGERPDPVRE